MITHDEQKQRFERTENGQTAVIEYRLRDGLIDLTHTYVPPELEGQGIAASLARYALDYAREQSLKVRPSCSYIRVYIQRHPEYGDLIG